MANLFDFDSSGSVSSLEQSAAFALYMMERGEWKKLAKAQNEEIRILYNVKDCLESELRVEAQRTLFFQEKLYNCHLGQHLDLQKKIYLFPEDEQELQLWEKDLEKSFSWGIMYCLYDYAGCNGLKRSERLKFLEEYLFLPYISQEEFLKFPRLIDCDEDVSDMIHQHYATQTYPPGAYWRELADAVIQNESAEEDILTQSIQVYLDFCSYAEDILRDCLGDKLTLIIRDYFECLLKNIQQYARPVNRTVTKQRVKGGSIKGKYSAHSRKTRQSAETHSPTDEAN